MFIVQNEARPAEIQNALFDLMRQGMERVRVCSAYISLVGSGILFDAICRSAPYGNHERVGKIIVTSLDYGLTDPVALQFWQDTRNCQVVVAGTTQLAQGSVLPRTAFHPKFYLFDRANGTIGSLVGSANLTNRGLTINSEVAWMEMEDEDTDQVNEAWDAAVSLAVPLTPEILNAYLAIRERVVAERLVEDLEPVPEPQILPAGRYPLFGDAHINPGAYEQMWVQSKGLQGGARTQLELPRGAHRFFGAEYANYEFNRVDHIAEPILVSGRNAWHDRPLTWHGDNAMERINLPSAAMGGFEYENSMILFRRIGQNRFELRVHPWDSDSARAYFGSSQTAGRVFRIGRNSNRLVGFIS